MIDQIIVKNTMLNIFLSASSNRLYNLTHQSIVFLQKSWIYPRGSLIIK